MTTDSLGIVWQLLAVILAAGEGGAFEKWFLCEDRHRVS
jgi:hypothetical protein